MSVYLHDPDATLDYVFDWSEWLADDETLDSAVLTASTGLVVDSQDVGLEAVTAWVSTTGALGRRTLACRVTTSASRTDERTIQINVEQR